MDAAKLHRYSLLGKAASAFLLALITFACGTSDSANSSQQNPPASQSLPPIRHVFTIVLENKSFDQTFTPNSSYSYISRQLPSQGTLLNSYYAIGHSSLVNYMALISGQAPNVVTQGSCVNYQDFMPPSPARFDQNGQAIGQGCVYPAEVDTVANQLSALGLSWRGYMEDMPSPCSHPALNANDTTQVATSGNQYAVKHNPFVYFHSIINTAVCGQNDVPLTQLTADLQSEARTPNYVFISPNLCHDGHDSPCVNGEPGGLVSVDGFLKVWVPQILNSAAYQHDGLLIILADEVEGDSSACCNEQPGPNVRLAGITGPGGGRTGALLLSKFVKSGVAVGTPHNHYSLLRTIEDLFGMPRLGFAGQNGLASFGSDVFVNNP